MEIIHTNCRKIINNLEKDTYYFESILEDKYKIPEEFLDYNYGKKYRELNAEELRSTAKKYILYCLRNLI